MSILHDQQPLIQTTEQSMSGEVTSVINRGVQLGYETMRRVTIRSDLPDFPSHETIRAAIKDIREVELVEIDINISAVSQEIAIIDSKLARTRERLGIIEDSIDDLGLSSAADKETRKFNGYSRTDVLQHIKTLEEAKQGVQEKASSLFAIRQEKLAIIEALEQRDFELLQLGG